jgi:hypothetical protein
MSVGGAVSRKIAGGLTTGGGGAGAGAASSGVSGSGGVGSGASVGTLGRAQLQYAPPLLTAKKTDLNELLTAMGRLAQQRVALRNAEEDTKTVCRLIHLKVQLSAAPLEKLQRTTEHSDRLQSLRALCKQQKEQLEKGKKERASE